MLAIDELIKSDEYKLYTNDGKNIDSFFCWYIYTLKNIPQRNSYIFDFVSNSIEYWEKFAGSCDAVFYNKFFNNSIFAIFYPSKDYPFFRFYFLSSTILAQYSIDKLISKFNANDFATSRFAMELVEKKDEFTMNAIKWFEEMDKKLNPLTKMANNKMKNTVIDKTVVLHRQPQGCVACGKKATGYISSILSGVKTIYFISHICDEHKEVAKKYPNFLNYILKLFEVGENIAPLQMSETIPNNALEILFKEIAKELDAQEVKEKRNYKPNINQTTATFRRKSGFTIKIRLNTLMKYAYIIDKPNGEQFKRIDSVNHHNDKLLVGPDHIHHDPYEETSKQYIEASYTTGFPLFDIPIIKQLLQEAESSFK